MWNSNYLAAALSSKGAEPACLQYNASESPVLALGGSLAGSLSFFLRYKYPAVADIALASSAPILGYPGAHSPTVS